ncbi:hypothetical protein JOF29_003613 [Kribbella aluminosa]|uniref:Uncharacterized protein n=1 Tax=Kribbella aluminosa TaxID=416017 RepID=A0ABS4ULM8_9ACTN|nr:hypothetical protein [Kribbella aluminosa]MBP2352530.1 hypothetical protein [Kribbella aluminosa]
MSSPVDGPRDVGGELRIRFSLRKPSKPLAATAPFYSYGVHKIYDQYGMHRVFDNQYGGAGSWI